MSAEFYTPSVNTKEFLLKSLSAYVERLFLKKVTKMQIYLNAFPDPAKDDVTLEYNLTENIENADLIITTLTGLEVTRFKLKNNESGLFTWHTDDVSSGIYLINIQNNGKNLLSQKVSIIK